MTQYIDKSAVVAEIKRRRKLVSDPILSGDDLMIGERNALFNLLSFINTLEVKEVDSDAHWISVEDELPKEGQVVLVTTTRGYVRMYVYEGGKFNDFIGAESEAPYWMPIPKPPKTFQYGKDWKGGKQ